ncbi:MAG TPA: AMP-binding protein [Steroidobacteraceae bacterium]
MSAELSSVPFREARFLPVDLDVEHRADGAVVMRSRIPLQPHEPCLPRVLAAQAERLGDKPYLVQRAGPDRAWRAHSYARTKQDSDAIAQWLLDLGIERDRPILLVSGNSIAHALMKFGGMTAGVPSCPISPNYGLMDAAFTRLRHVLDLARPGVVFIEDARPFTRALDQVDFGDAVLVTATPDSVPANARVRGVVALEEVLATRVTNKVRERLDSLRGDDHAFYMLTSGSTGAPKAVIQTYANVAANITQALQTIGEAAGWHRTTMDWLPWNHVSGACGKMITLTAGGTLYIDDGKPIPGPLWQESLRNLREISSSYYVNVPLGYQLLVEALEADDDLRRTFFQNLQVLLYGGAGLPQTTYERLQRLAVKTIGRRVMLISAYGSTETTSGCLAIHFETDQVGIGVPMPGIQVKLVPVDKRYEVRISGPVVTPGYLRDPKRTAESRDEEGYYRMGDLAVFHDPKRPEKGLAFAGRLAEEFKLGSGTWVSGGELRTTLLQALAPYIDELVLCGENRTSIAVLAWPNRAVIEREFGISSKEPLRADSLGPLLAVLRERLAAHNARYPGASTRVQRFALLQEPPLAAAHELSDKGTVNRNAVLTRRTADVERVYADPPGSDVISFD